MKSFQQLSYHERVLIHRGLCDQKSITKIAKDIGRDKSVISREVKINSDHVGYLYPADAHKAAINRKNINEPKIDRDPDLKRYIILKLKERWSPRTIAARWTLENESEICTESIYTWLYESKEAINLGLTKLLVRSKKRRGLKKKKIKEPKIK